MFQPNLEKSKFRKALHFGLVRKLERERERESVTEILEERVRN